MKMTSRLKPFEKTFHLGRHSPGQSLALPSHPGDGEKGDFWARHIASYYLLLSRYRSGPFRRKVTPAHDFGKRKVINRGVCIVRFSFLTLSVEYRTIPLIGSMKRAYM